MTFSRQLSDSEVYHMDLKVFFNVIHGLLLTPDLQTSFGDKELMLLVYTEFFLV
jgi:hypothetical protein